MTSKKLSPIKKIFFSFIVVISILLIQETLLRLIFPIPEVTNFNRINYSPILHVPEQGSPQYLANVAFRWASDPDGVEFIHNLNLYGFRDKTWEVEHTANYQRAMFIGNSFVEGFMASDKETIPQGFEKAAREKSHLLETLNLGIGASQLPEYFMLMRDAVPLFKPNYLLLVLFENDFFSVPQFDPSWFSPLFIPKYSRPLTPRLYAILENIRAHKSVPHIWHNSPFSFVASTPDPRNPWSSKEYADQWEKIVTPQIAEAMKRGRFNPYALNYYDRLEKTLRQSVDISPHLMALKEFVTQFSCQLFIAYIPCNHQVSDAYLSFLKEFNENENPSSLMEESYQIHARTLANTCRQLNIPFWDSTAILRQYEEEGERLYWDYDSHMKGKGYLLVGKYLYEWFTNQLAESQLYSK